MQDFRYRKLGTEGQPYDELLKELLNMFERRVPSHPKAKYDRALYLANGWLMQVQNGCLAALLLERSGLRPQTAPILRSVTEHVVALKWLVLDGNAILDPLNRALDLNLTKQVGAATGLNFRPVDPALAQSIRKQAEEANSALDTFNHFKHRAERVDANFDYMGFLLESSFCHPSIQTAGVYRESGDKRVMDIGWSCVQDLFNAIVSYAQVFDPVPWQNFKDLNDRYQAILTARRKEAGLPD